MDKSLKSRIRKIAMGVRKWAEDIQKKNRVWYTKDLCGMCAISSAELHKRLRRKGIYSRIVFGRGHVFLVVKGYVVDVTATQFSNLPFSSKVVIRPWEKMKEYGEFCWLDPWEPRRIVKSVTEAERIQRNDMWPGEQSIGRFMEVINNG